MCSNSDEANLTVGATHPHLAILDDVGAHAAKAYQLHVIP
jgi:hypothetical protein